MIKEFVKNKNGEKIGVLVATSIDDFEVGIGWSKVHTQLDKFNKERGEEIAIGRAIKAKDLIYIPLSFDKKMDDFIERCRKYYKDKEFIQV